jgi:YebC/PmpR family DNA-binding regulatory protein
LRSAIQAAKAANMPKDNVERAVSKSELNKELNYTNIIYEGFGPEKIAVIVEALTDNKNRPASNIRTIFQKNGGNLGSTGVASHQFNQVGVIRIDKKKISDNDIIELAINSGAEDCVSNQFQHEIITLKENFYKVKIEIERVIQDFISAGIEWLAINKVSLDEEKTRSVLSFLEILEDDDDVQYVYANIDIVNSSETEVLT